MCRNHSHIKANPIGLLRVGVTDLMEYRMLHQLEVQSTSGHKLTVPYMSALWLPVSGTVLLPPSMPVQTEVCFIPLSYITDAGTITTPGPRWRLNLSGDIGETGLSGMGTYQSSDLEDMSHVAWPDG